MSLDPAEHRRIFLERIVPQEFEDAVPSLTPAVVLMGGQPGSGKSGLLDEATAYLSTSQAPAVQIVGDDLRDYHPDFKRLLAVDDRTAAAATDQDSGRWVEMCLAHARENRYSVVVEGTMRNPQVPLQTAAAFRGDGYDVEAWVMAVDPLSSKLGILLRYHEQREALGHGRFTVDAAHDAGAAGLLDSVDAIQDTRAVDRIVVAVRGPRVLADLPGDVATPRVRDIITAERTRPWSPQEVQDFTARAAQLTEALPAGHEHHELVDQLVEAAVDRGRHYEVFQAARIARAAFPTTARDAVQRPPGPTDDHEPGVAGLQPYRAQPGRPAGPGDVGRPRDRPYER